MKECRPTGDIHAASSYMGKIILGVIVLSWQKDKFNHSTAIVAITAHAA